MHDHSNAPRSRMHKLIIFLNLYMLYQLIPRNHPKNKKKTSIMFGKEFFDSKNLFEAISCFDFSQKNSLECLVEGLFVLTF